jgi:ketosteroid isomerase-like protein
MNVASRIRPAWRPTWDDFRVVEEVPDEPGAAPAVRALVLNHVAAFNAHSTAQLLAGLAEDAVWETGKDVVRDQDGLRELFDDWLWSLNPKLTVRTLVTQGARAAAELREDLGIDKQRRSMNIAVFFETDAGRIRSVKVYREGQAEID